jgi:hypothetical protein
MTSLAFDLPENCDLETVLVDGAEVSTWAVQGLPMIIRQTFDVRDLISPLAFDFVHGGYLRQLVEESPFGSLKTSGRASVSGSEESTLSRTESGAPASVTYVLSAVAPNTELVCTLQVSYPVGRETECQPIALACLKSALVP